MHEPLAAEIWLASRLAGDTTLRSQATGGVHAGAIPQGADPPAVVYRYLSGSDTTGTGAIRVLSWLEYLVEGIVRGAGEKERLLLIASRIDELLQAASAVTAEATVSGVDRREPWRADEFDDGVRTYRAGGIYRLWLSRPA